MRIARERKQQRLKEKLEYSNHFFLRLGAELRATGVYTQINEDCERAKATTP